MKKLLLSTLFAATAAMTCGAAVIEDYYGDFQGNDKFPFFVMGYEPTIENGILTAQKPEDSTWYQFFIADGIVTTPGTDYTVTVKAKASEAASLAIQMGWGWGNGEQINSQIALTTEWSECTTNFVGVEGTKSNVVLQPGGYAGKIEIEWIRVTHDGDGPLQPGDANSEILASYFTDNGQEFYGWGATFEKVTEDGKTCLAMTNTEAKDSWAVQACISYDFDFDTVYYLNFDVKGTVAATGIEVGFQHSDGYKGCGSMPSFRVGTEWTNVTLYAQPTPPSAAPAKAPGLMTDDSLKPDRLLLNLGKYVGTMYISNVNLYKGKTDTSALETVNVEEEAAPVVYNLQGIRIATENVNSLPAGLYIVNGKKVLVK